MSVPSQQAPDSVHAAEAALLSRLTKTPYTKRAVHLPKSGHVLNTISLGREDAPALILLHGWGAGVAFWGANLGGLSAHFRVHVIDWLGFGASSRAPHDLTWDATAAEDFFVEPLAEWAEAMRNFEPDSFATGKVHVVGHSMGAFLASAFALRYPGLVSNLVLASPVGLPRAPRDKLALMKGSTMRRTMFRAIFALWEWGWTPQVLMRMAGGRFGRKVAAWMITRRFPTDNVETREAFVEYFYQISAASPSGEYSLSTILESGAYARRPMCDRLKQAEMPVAFLYGDKDWMSWEAAEEVGKGMKVKNWIRRVKGAGHHLYYDKADEFNHCVVEACHQVTVIE